MTPYLVAMVMDYFWQVAGVSRLEQIPVQKTSCGPTCAGIRVGPAMNVAYDAIFRTALPLHVPLLSVGISSNR